MENNKFVVSTYDLMPILEDALQQGKKAKFKVTGNSMLPWISHNRDQVLLASTKGRSLKLGDIILFRDNTDKYILHRIYKKDGRGYYTIGDGCIVEDGLVNPEDILGIVEKIYRKRKEIDCNALYWRCIFFLWRKLLPIRKYLLCLYALLVKVKILITKQ